jgi:hypothetical protein
MVATKAIEAAKLAEMLEREKALLSALDTMPPSKQRDELFRQLQDVRRLLAGLESQQ